MSTLTVTPHKDYTLMANEVDSVRTATLGSFFVKRKPRFLPHPSQVDTTSPQQVKRYEQYVAGAEFAEFTQATLSSMLGKMKIDDTDIEMNSKLEYLIEDSDGDGLSLKGLLESCASNVLQVKWHFLLSDYMGLSDVALTDISIADKERLKPRATIKQYTRENVLDWHFTRKNGRMQLVYVLLRECGTELDPNTLQQEEVTSYLRVGVDDEGYFQQKLVGNSSGGVVEGERIHPLVKGKTLQFIPCQIASDCELTSAGFPLDTGFLTAISDLALYRYRVSADYKEALSSLQPMVNVCGVDDHDWETFKKVNGRDYIATGAKSPNIFPNADTKVELSEPSLTLEQFERFFDRNEELVRASGGVFNTVNAVQRTATEVMTESHANTALLQPLATSIENAVEWCVAYCGMFEGIYAVDNLQAGIEETEISMPREFAVAKLSDAEVKVMHETMLSGAISKEEFLRILDVGGRLVSEVDVIVGEIEATPTIIE